MPPSPSTRFADKLHAWSPSLANFGNSIQDSLPHSSEEFKQRLRSWNRSLSKRYPRAFKNTGDSPSDQDSTEKLHAAEHDRIRLQSDLVAARKAVAENVRLTKQLRALREQKDTDLHVAAGIIESKARDPATVSGQATSTVTPVAERRKVSSSNVRVTVPVPKQFNSATGIRKDVRVFEPHTSRGTERKYIFRFQEATPHRPSSVEPSLHRSASVSSLAGQFSDSVKRFRRSASNVSLRNNFFRSAGDEHGNLEAPVNSLRHSAPPCSLPGDAQSIHASLDSSLPARYAHSRELTLDSIAEDSEYQRPRHQDFRQDKIFALHNSRVCPPRVPPIVVDRLNIGGFARRQNAAIGSNELTRSSTGSTSSSNHLHSRTSSATVQLFNQINRTNDMAALRNSINETRALQGAPPLQIYQDLCAEAGIVATMCDVLNSTSGRRRSWGTDIQLQESSTSLELIGPPRVGGRVTGKMWADGEHSRRTQSSHIKFSPNDHEGCPCHDFKVWEAITDSRWRAIGISRTEAEERCVVVLSE